MSDNNKMPANDRKTQNAIKDNILMKSASIRQRQQQINRQLNSQHKKLKNIKQSMNDTSGKRQEGDQDLRQMRENKNIFKQICCYYCCCCCGKCCENTDETNVAPIETKSLTTVTESEEPDPDVDTIEKMWTKHYQPKTWREAMDYNIRQLIDEAEDAERRLNRNIKLTKKLDTKAKDETKALKESIDVIKDVRDN